MVDVDEFVCFEHFERCDRFRRAGDDEVECGVKVDGPPPLSPIG